MTCDRPIYLDYAATTPVDARVIAAMHECLGPDQDFGNPASATHLFGRRAAARVVAAREQVAALIGAQPAEIVFTSGATESDNLALLGVAQANADRGRHLVTTRIEHKAVGDAARFLEKCGWAVTYLRPDAHGRIDPESVREALRPETQLVSVMAVNNEIGVIADIERIGALCRERGVPFHTDAAQAAARVELDVRALPVDLLAFTAHKLYGPKGIGALYVRERTRAGLRPLLYGGGQERGLRPGTLATHQIVGFGAACELIRRERAREEERIAALAARLWAGLRAIAGTYLNGVQAPRVPGILNVSFEGVEGESLVSGLAELALSTGSACNSASAEPSYVLRALGRSSQLAQSSLRFSLGRYTQEKDVDLTIAAVRREVERLRARSPAAAPASTGSGELYGEAGAREEGTWVRFQLAVAADSVTAARFQAYGCPHTFAVCEWLCERLTGRSRHDLLPGGPTEWAQALQIPVEKLGRLLVVEDALQDCVRRWHSANAAPALE